MLASALPLRLLVACLLATASASGEADCGAAGSIGDASARGCTNEGQRKDEDTVVTASSVQMLQQGLHLQGSSAAAGLAGDGGNESTNDEDMALLQLKASVAHPSGPPRSRGNREASTLLHEPSPPAEKTKPKRQSLAEKRSKKEPVILAKSRNASTWCGYDMSPGFMTALTLPNSDSFMLDIGDEMERNGVVRFMVTAMAVTGTYADSMGYLTQYAYPQEDIISTMFEMRLGSDNRSVDVYYPEVDIRTSDKQSTKAVQRGTGNGWYDTLNTYFCSSSGGSFALRGPSAPMLQYTKKDRLRLAKAAGQGTDLDDATSFAMTGNSTSAPLTKRLRPVVIDGGYLLQQGFYTDTTVGAALSYRLISVKSYPNNLDVTAEFVMPDGFPLSVGFSIVRLREKPMTPRVADDRLLYFTQEYKDLGWHSRHASELQSDAVDRTVNTIWRYDLASLPDQQIKLYVDPTVPKRWREDFRAGIERWNSAFALVGRPNAVRAIVPEDKDWPADYEVADARFNTISWVVSNQVVSMGIAKVDPRSGEILKSDITMSDGWVRSWLGDLDLLAPNFTHRIDVSGGFRRESVLTGGNSASYAGRSGLLQLQQELQREALTAEAASPPSASWGKKVSLLSTAGGNPLSPEEMKEVLGMGLRHIVSHETGHILGLRHNFKGSMGISYECTRNASCTNIHGLTVSVMDYVPTNMPALDGSGPKVDVFSPVLGAYDKLAIRYGYMPASDQQPGHIMELVPELRALLEEAEAYETCYDFDRGTQDPSCAAYDMSSEPLRYLDAQLDRLVLVQKFLLNASVLPGASYTKYGEAVLDVMSLALGHALDASAWLGGVINRYAYRHLNSSSTARKVGRQAVSASEQRKAVDLMLRVMRMKESGLLPPEEGLPFLIQSPTNGIDSIETLDIDSKVRIIVHDLMDNFLQSSTLSRMHDFASMTPSSSADQPLSVGEYLAMLVNGVVKQGLASAPKTDWDMHAALVDGLAKLYKKHQSALPEEVLSQVLVHLRGLYGEVDTSLMQVGNSNADDILVRDHLLSLRQRMWSTVCNGGGGAPNCDMLLAQTATTQQSAAAPTARRPLLPLVAATAAFAAMSGRAA